MLDKINEAHRIALYIKNNIGRQPVRFTKPVSATSEPQIYWTYNGQEYVKGIFDFGNGFSPALDASIEYQVAVDEGRRKPITEISDIGFKDSE